MKKIEIRFFVLTVVFSLFGLMASPAISSASDFDGMIGSNTVWTESQNPYNLTSTVQIPKGITLRIEAGVRITGTGLKDAFLVAGKLEIVGTKENPVRIQNVQNGNIFRTIGDDPTINITNALISNGATLWKSEAAEYKASFTLANSEVIGISEPIYVWYPKHFSVTGSYFKDTGGFSIGMRKCSGGPQHSDDVQIINNTFDGKAGWTYNGEGWIVGWVTYCEGQINVTNNYFKNPSGTVISVAKGYRDPININANGNYWEGMTQSQIANLVLDATDSLDYYHTVSTSGALSAIPAGAPVKSVILQERQAAADKAAADKAAADKAAADKAAADKAAADKAAADKAAAAVLTAKRLADSKAIALKKTTIYCIKGKVTKKVTAVKPFCPSGYKKK